MLREKLLGQACVPLGTLAYSAGSSGRGGHVRPTFSTSLAISLPQRAEYPRRTMSPRETEPLQRSTDAVVRHKPHQKLLSSHTLISDGIAFQAAIRTRRSRRSRSLCWHGRCRGSSRVRADGGNEGPGERPCRRGRGRRGDDRPHVPRHHRQVIWNSSLLVQEVPNIGNPRSGHLTAFQTGRSASSTRPSNATHSLLRTGMSSRVTPKTVSSSTAA
jgi:hypothetical protein